MLTLTRDDIDVIIEAVDRIDKTNPVIAEMKNLRKHQKKRNFCGFTLCDIGRVIKDAIALHEDSFDGNDYAIDETEAVRRACLTHGVPVDAGKIVTLVIDQNAQDDLLKIANGYIREG